MTIRRAFETLTLAAILLLGALCPSSLAQGPLPEAPKPGIQPATPAPKMQTRQTFSLGEQHKFWDNGNRALFAGVIASNAADFAMTYTNLQSGGRELNPMVRVFGRSAPGLALNFGGQVAGVMGVSYFLHKTGHHRLERMASVVNIGASMTAVGYGFAHR
ncbi:MAG: hypothetical protein WAN03_19440 [Candidatus Sulfotelmatobacter sp.]